MLEADQSPDQAAPPRKQALTGRSGAFGASDAAFNPASFTYPLLAPGTDGVPADDPYESGFANGDRNIFRSAFQKSANIAFVKQTKIYEKTNLRLSMEFLNITNTPSFDTPGNNFTGAPNFGPPYLPIGPGADPATFSDQGGEHHNQSDWWSASDSVHRNSKLLAVI
jgi:hypothetical protein